MNCRIDIRLISQEDIIKAKCVDYYRIINVIENSLLSYKKGDILMPDKISQIFDEESQDRINCMPSTLLNEKVCGVKWVSVFPYNPNKYFVPNVSGIIILSEIEKGHPFSIIDGTLITALRTACMGALAAKCFARKSSKIYGTIGTGYQAKMHFKCIKNVIKSIDTCFVSSRTSESEDDFISEMSDVFPDVNFVKCNSNYDKATINSDIIVTAVSSQKPLLKADCIKKGAFYCHVGGYEDEYEVPLKADKIICDDWNSLKHRGSPTIAKMYKEGILKDTDIYSNIVDILDGTKVGRANDDEFIYFNSIGLSYIDIAVAYDFYNRVCEQNYGSFWSMINDERK